MPEPNAAIAEVIAIGDEMTSGARLDTNSQWISQALRRLGVRVHFHTTVGDAADDCLQVFTTAARRADIIVATGGLGPTEDDLTREVLARAAGVPLEFRPEAMEHIERIFARRARAIPERNRVQAMFPATSKIIPNPQGTAPGIDLCLPGDSGTTARVFALPGIPAEMHQMWAQTVAPRIAAHAGTHAVIRDAVIQCFGIGESDMEALLGGMIARQRSPRVGITVSRATISLRIEAVAATAAEADAQIASTREEIHQRVGQYVFGEGEGVQLQDVVAQQLATLGHSLAVIEIGHAAAITDWMAALERPERFAGGMHFSTMPLARRSLRTLAAARTEPVTPPPRPVATGPSDAADLLDLAAAARGVFASDWVLVVDSYPSTIPEAGSILPASEVRFAVLGPGDADPAVWSAAIGGHPEILHARIAKTGLFGLYHQVRRATASSTAPSRITQ